MSGMTAPVPPAAPARDLNEVFTLVTPQIAALDVFMREQVGHFEPEIREMAAYCLETSGKRLRPTLIFVSGWQGAGVVNPDLVRAAGVVEMVHLATLVHDDIMDEADIRRNRRTASRAYGAEAAVLLGDALFSQALHVASQFPTTEVCRVVSASTRQVCSGEIMQTLRRRSVDVTLADYYRVIDLKTAELFRVSCFLGARLAGHGPEFVTAANNFGRHLGIAYQIYDDLVDFFGEEKQIGKTLGTDLASGKLTLPLMLLLERSAPAERLRLLEALREGVPFSLRDSAAQMRHLGIAAGVIDAIDRELADAQRELAPYLGLPPTPLLLQLCGVLRAQVAGLTTRAAG